MRKLIVETQLSIDGYIADMNGNTDWMIWNWGPDWNWDAELQQYHTRLTKSIGLILLSRQMAEEGFIAHWNGVTENPKDLRFEFAKHIDQTHKIVFTKTLNKSIPIPGGWDNTEIEEGDYVEAIAKLKKMDGDNMVAYGGATFLSSLFKAELVDEMHLIVNPIIIGNGMPVFRDIAKEQDFNLVKATPFDCGIVVLHYRK